MSSDQALRDLYANLSKGRQDFDFMSPALVSHAKDYGDQPERLRLYAKQVISGRIMILLASSHMTTQSLLQTYLFGMDTKRPLPLLLSARAQLELYAVVADVVRVIKENQGEQEERFTERVHAVDAALISATFGTRSVDLKNLLDQQALSRLRPNSQEDMEALTARNILSRLEKLSKKGEYKECLRDYERLCEFVHPNWGMNMLYLVPSPVDSRLLRFSMTSNHPYERALAASKDAMEKAAQRTIETLRNLQSPFGEGIAVRL